MLIRREAKLRLTLKPKLKAAARGMLAILWAAAIFWMGANACRRYLYGQPCRVKLDCRGKGITVEIMEGWEKMGKNSIPGLVKIAGWRIAQQQKVSSPSTGRQQDAQVICAYGSMELVEPAKLVSGRYGLAAEGGFCVLSEALSRHLFGSTDIAGEWVEIGQDRLQVAGVVEKDEDFAIIPMEDGEAEQIAAEFGSRAGAREGLCRLLGE